MLKYKTAIVTGASSGIGFAAAKLFAQQGAAVIAIARRANRLQQLVVEIEAAGGRAVALVGDVSQEACMQEAVALATEQFGGLDIAFNNAAILGPVAEVSDLSRADWQQTLDINLTSAFLAAKYQIPAMLKRGGGSLIFTSSFVGHCVGFPGMAAYASSKAGLVGLTRVLAAEYSQQGIRVNALLPGGTDTEMGRQSASTAEQYDFVCGLHAMKRLATAEEIANAALYLASDLSTFVTGSTLMAEGGITITRT